MVTGAKAAKAKAAGAEAVVAGAVTSGLVASRLVFRFERASPLVLDDASITVAPGEIVGLGGPSGGGKSTLARLLAGHLDLQAGTIAVDGRPPPRAGFHPVQLLLQTAELAVNPRWPVARILGEAHAPDPGLRRAFGIADTLLDRHPHELSGGELQRIAILRALAPGLRYLIADEISAMLDPITQVEIWRLLRDVAETRGVGILAISHDAPLLDKIAARVGIMDGGKISWTGAGPGHRPPQAT